jgi:hypothetical protein
VRISVDARTIAGGSSGIVTYRVEIVGLPDERGPRDPRVLALVTTTATGPDKSPDMQRTAELALEQLENAAKEARATMVLHKLIPAAPEPAPDSRYTNAEWSALCERLDRIAERGLCGMRDASDGERLDEIRKQISELRERDRVCDGAATGQRSS